MATWPDPDDEEGADPLDDEEPVELDAPEEPDAPEELDAPEEPDEPEELPDVPPVELVPVLGGVVDTDVLEAFCKVVSWAARPIRPAVAAAAPATTPIVVRRSVSIARSRPAAAIRRAWDGFRWLEELIVTIMPRASKTPVRRSIAFAKTGDEGAPDRTPLGSS